MKPLRRYVAWYGKKGMRKLDSKSFEWAFGIVLAPKLTFQSSNYRLERSIFHLNFFEMLRLAPDMLDDSKGTADRNSLSAVPINHIVKKLNYSYNFKAIIENKNILNHFKKFRLYEKY